MHFPAASDAPTPDGGPQAARAYASPDPIDRAESIELEEENLIEEFTAPSDSPEPILPAAPPPQVTTQH